MGSKILVRIFVLATTMAFTNGVPIHTKIVRLPGVSGKPTSIVTEIYRPGTEVACGGVQKVNEGESYYFRSRNSDRSRRSPYWYPRYPSQFPHRSFQPFPHPRFPPPPPPYRKPVEHPKNYSPPQPQFHVPKPKICKWRFETDSNCQLEATFDHFEGGNGNCYRQYVLIGDEEREIQICGYTPFPGYFKSSGRELFIKHFKQPTTWSAEFEGFVTCIKKYQSEFGFPAPHDTYTDADKVTESNSINEGGDYGNPATTDSGLDGSVNEPSTTDHYGYLGDPGDSISSEGTHPSSNLEYYDEQDDFDFDNEVELSGEFESEAQGHDEPYEPNAASLEYNPVIAMDNSYPALEEETTPEVTEEIYPQTTNSTGAEQGSHKLYADTTDEAFVETLGEVQENGYADSTPTSSSDSAYAVTDTEAEYTDKNVESSVDTKPYADTDGSSYPDTEANVEATYPEVNVEATYPEANVEATYPEANVEATYPEVHVVATDPEANVDARYPEANVETTYPENNPDVPYPLTEAKDNSYSTPESETKKDSEYAKAEGNVDVPAYASAEDSSYPETKTKTPYTDFNDENKYDEKSNVVDAGYDEPSTPYKPTPVPESYLKEPTVPYATDSYPEYQQSTPAPYISGKDTSDSDLHRVASESAATSR